MSDETLGHVEIKLNLGGNEYLLGIRHFHIIDVVSGEPLEAAKLGKSIRSALDESVAGVLDNVALWGFEGLVLEATGRVERKKS